MLKSALMALVTLAILCAAIPTQARPVTLVAITWDPFTNEKMPQQGFLADITLEALRRAGHEPQLTFSPWKRALEMARTGEVDGLVGAVFTEERTRDFIYPKFFWPVAFSIFTRAGKNDTYISLEALCPGIIGLLRGTMLEERLKSVPCLKIDLSSDVKQNLTKLSAGRIDYLLESREVVLYLLAGPLSGVKNIKPMEPPFEVYNMYTIFSRIKPDAADLVAAFDAGIEELKADGTWDAILKKYGIQ